MLLSKMLQDIRKNYISFIAIFIMAFICLMIYSGISVADNVYINQYITESNFRDLDIRGGLFSTDNIDELKEDSEIIDVEGYYNTSGKIIMDEEVKILISYISGNNISKMYIVEGEPYIAGEEGVWLEKNICEAKGIKVGDICEISSENMIFYQEVKGIVYSPQYIYYLADSTYTEPSYTEYGFAIMDESQKNGDYNYYNQLLVDTRQGGTGIEVSEKDNIYLSRIKDTIKKKLESDTLIILDRKQDVGLNSYLSDIKSAKALAAVFPTIFGAIAILGIISTMSRIISKQRTDIGTLKAFGYTDRTIVGHYSSYSFFIILAGCVLGAVIGYYTIGSLMLTTVTEYYLNPLERKYLTPMIFFETLILLFVSVAVTYICVRKILKESIASVLRPDVPLKQVKSFYENLSFWKKFRFATQWNIRDITTHPLRTMMSLLGVIICSALIFSSFSYLECFEYQPDWSYEVLIKAKYRIEFSDTADYNTVYDYAMEYDGQMVEKRNVNIYSDKETSGYYLTIVDSGNNYFLNGVNGEYMLFSDNGVIMSEKTSKVCNIPVNSIIDFSIHGEDYIYSDRVIAINKIPYSQGIVMTRNHYETMHGTFRPNCLYTEKSVLKNLEEQEDIISVVSIEELKQGVQNAIASNYITVMTMAFLAVFLGTTMMLNMGVMSYNEKIRDMAVLKVLGFGTKDLKRLLMQQNFYITLAGCFIGIFFGFPILDMLLLVSGDMTDFVILTSKMPYIVDICATFIVSIVVNLHIVSGIENVNMVEELKEI